MDLETLAGAGRAPPPAPLAQGPSPQSTVNLRDPPRQDFTVRYGTCIRFIRDLASRPSHPKRTLRSVAVSPSCQNNAVAAVASCRKPLAVAVFAVNR